MSTPTRRMEIEDEVFELEIWPTSKALEWQHKLIQIGLEPAAMLMDETPEGATLDQGQYATLARTIATKLDAHGVDKLMHGLLSHVWLIGSLDGKETRQRVTDKGAWDRIFAGRLMLVHRLAWWVLEENFADFIGAARSFVGVLRDLWQNVLLVKRASEPSASAAAPIEATAADAPSSPSPPTTTT